MTKAELIEAMKDFPDSMEVKCYRSDDCGNYEESDIDDVDFIDNSNYYDASYNKKNNKYIRLYLY